MKHATLTALILLSLAVVMFSTTAAAEQSAAQVSAMKKRAEHITRMKNNFVMRVLESYKIKYKLTPDGVVGAIEMDDRWIDVNQIDIVPVADEKDMAFHVRGHEIYFYTDEQIIHLVSDLVVR